MSRIVELFFKQFCLLFVSNCFLLFLSHAQSIGDCPQTQIVGVNVDYQLCLPNASSVSASVSSLAPPLSYSIDGGLTSQSGPVFSNVPPGTYVLQVTDAFNCTSGYTFTVLNPSLPVFTSIVIKDANCSLNSGVIEYDVVGGSGNYAYALIFPSGPNAFPTTDSISGLVAGTYTIQVEDANGCEIDTTVVIQSYTFPVIGQIIANNPTCNSTNGSIEITLSNPPPASSSYTTNYSINGGFSYQTSPIFNNLPAGTYLIYAAVTSCLSNFGQPIVINLSQESYVNFISAGVQNADCGLANGSVQINVSPNPSGLLFSINGGPFSNSTGLFSNLSSGTYTLAVLDDLGCTKDTLIVIPENSGSNFVNLSVSNPSCGETDGQLAIVIDNDINGTAVFSIDNGVTFQSDSVFANLSSGTYTIILQNNPNCFVDTTLFIGEQSGPSIVSVNTIDPACSIENGSIEIIGSISPLVYSIDGGVTFQNSGLFTSLASGNYSIVIQTNALCFDDTSIVLADNSIPVVDAGNDLSLCQGESVTLAANASVGAAISWNNGVINGQAFTPQATANYIVTATYSNGCNARDTLTVTIFDIIQPQIQYSITTNCLPATVHFSLNDSLFTGCEWMLNNGISANDCDSTAFVFDQAGCYTVSFSGTNALGCAVQVQLQNPICFDENPEANFTFLPQALTTENTLVQFENQSQYAQTFQWLFPNGFVSNGLNPSHMLPATPGSYPITLIAFDVDGCKDSITKLVVVEEIKEVYVPNAFTPDGDEFNQSFQPKISVLESVSEYSFSVFNRWGELLFESRNPLYGWDGTYNGYAVQAGSYVYKIEIKYTNETSVYTYFGHVNLIK